MNRLASLGLILFAGCSTGADLSTASSAITLDTTTGVGFVGKGAVQSLFGWNNAGLQANVGGITFSFEASGVYEQSCVHQANKKVVQVTFKKTVELSSAVGYTARRNPKDKVNGFNLTGIAASSPTVPTDLCNPGQSEPEQVWTPDPTGAYPQVTQTSGTPATLSVTFAGETHPIWIEGADEGETESD